MDDGPTLDEYEATCRRLNDGISEEIPDMTARTLTLWHTLHDGRTVQAQVCYEPADNGCMAETACDVNGRDVLPELDDADVAAIERHALEIVNE